MSLTRKHFEQMADIILSQQLEIAKQHDDKFMTDGEYSHSKITLRMTAMHLANMCEKENTKFNRAKFMQACGF